MAEVLRERRAQLVVNREIQPRRGRKTDVYLDAVPREDPNNPARRLMVVVEVKGSWHRNLWQAMDTQLVNEYLLPDGLGHGIYVVGWVRRDALGQERSKKASYTEASHDEGCRPAPGAGAPRISTPRGSAPRCLRP